MFPFSLLPLLPQELILKKMSPVEIFFFSLISRKSHRLAKRSKLVVKEVRWSLNKYCTDIDVIGIRNGQRLFLRTSSRDPDPFESELPKFDARVDDTQFSVFMLAHSFWESLDIMSSNSSQCLAETISKRLMDVLRPQEFGMRIKYCSIPPFIFRYTRTFESVYAEFSNTPLHNNEALILLNEITTNYLSLDHAALKFPENQPPFKHKQMVFVIVPWFTKEFLMRMECEELFVIEPNLTSLDLQEFFERWKEGKFPKLREVRIRLLIIRNLNLNMAPVDDEGIQVITDIGGKVGKLSFDDYFLKFLVEY